MQRWANKIYGQDICAFNAKVELRDDVESVCIAETGNE